MRCGVLALQGDWTAHLGVLRRLGADAVPVRTASDLAVVDGLVLPGGESTAMLRLMASEALVDRIRLRVSDGMPVLATCAGIILLATEVQPQQPSIASLDVTVRRNAFGRQVHSDIVTIELAPELGSPSTTRGIFIRAPRITRVGPEVETLGRRDGEPVLVRQGSILAATYHPELTGDDRVHRWLVTAPESVHD